MLMTREKVLGKFQECDIIFSVVVKFLVCVRNSTNATEIFAAEEVTKVEC